MRRRRLILVHCIVFAALLCGLSIAGLAQTKLIIARHGTSAYDPANPQLVNGIPDPPLAQAGREEAARLAKLAQAEGGDELFQRMQMRADADGPIVRRGSVRRHCRSRRCLSHSSQHPAARHIKHIRNSSPA